MSTQLVLGESHIQEGQHQQDNTAGKSYNKGQRQLHQLDREHRWLSGERSMVLNKCIIFNCKCGTCSFIVVHIRKQAINNKEMLPQCLSSSTLPLLTAGCPVDFYPCSHLQRLL